MAEHATIATRMAGVPVRQETLRTTHKRSLIAAWLAVALGAVLCLVCNDRAYAAVPEPPPAEGPAAIVDVEVTKKGAGKEVVVRKGAREWYMLVEVTPDNTVIVRQEKEHDRYIVDESETHDRPFMAQEVDDAIADFVNSAKTQAAKQK